MQGIVDACRRPLFPCVLVALALGLACMVGTAAADRPARASASSEVVVKRGDRGDAVRRIQRALGVSADGVFGSRTQKAVKRLQHRKALTVDGIVGPQTRAALGLAPFSRSSVRRQSTRRQSTGARVPRALRLIAECESGGNPRAVSPGGRYRGKYQFSVDTWRNLGGAGDPADASEVVQDRIAVRLYRRSGTTPWPSCAQA